MHSRIDLQHMSTIYVATEGDVIIYYLLSCMRSSNNEKVYIIIDLILDIIIIIKIKIIIIIISNYGYFEIIIECWIAKRCNDTYL